ncbi:MAG: bifunctional hydroxymethylpyrimidine kinase/phosphomethylpyrimidine kinase [Mobilitalea sp.]
MKTVLTIAGSDSSGGAGIQADIKTITAHKLYAMSAITALTAQNTTGVYGIMEVTSDFLANQLECIFSDIYPDAVKIGMVSSSLLIEAIASKLIKEKAKNIVVDPVMISTSGSKLLAEDAAVTLIEKLIPIATIITPNIPEAEVLSGMKIIKVEDMITAAEKIARKYNGAILIKGGHSLNDANDLLFQDGKVEWFYGERIDNPNTHGTGCTLSSAIACNLAMGHSLFDSVSNAKKYISGALKSNLNLGKGSGPLDHTFAIRFD